MTEKIPETTTDPAVPKSKAAERFVTLDVMRGFVMLALSWGLIGRDALDQQPAWAWLGQQLHHVKWTGLAFWDMIQPFFWFVVGAALPFARARRIKTGEPRSAMLRHSLWRAAKLVLVGQILLSIQISKPVFNSHETLTQLAACYLLCVLIFELPLRGQVLAAAGLMALNWGLYQVFPGSAGPFSPADNVGVVIDRAVFGLDSAGRWVTIYFIGSAVSMLIGAWAGTFLLGPKTRQAKTKILAAAGAGDLALGLILSPFNPVMQKTWTASYTFLTSGIVVLVLAALFWTLDVKGWKKAAYPLVVVGMNGIFFYALSQALGAWVDQSLAVFTHRFAFAGALAPLLQPTAAVGLMWYVCLWLYKRKIFFKL